MFHRGHRSELAQYVQSQYDPESPESIASANRALEFQRGQRVQILSRLWQEGSDELLAHYYALFVSEDKDIVLLLPSLVAARVIVLLHKERAH